MKKLFYDCTATALAVTLLCMCQIFVANAQNGTGELLTPVSSDKSKMNQSQRAAANKLEQLKHYKKVEYVKFGNVSKIQKDGVLTFSIPGRAKKVKAIANKVEAFSEEDFEWYGMTEDGLGQVNIISKGGKKSAGIYLEDQTYEIYSLEDDLYALLTPDTTRTKNDYCGTPPDGTLETKPEKLLENDANGRVGACNDFVRVLVLFTARARNSVANINQTVDQSIAQFNSTVYNSGITSLITVQLAGRQEFDFNEGNGGLGATVLNQFVADPRTLQLRNQFQADIVILLTDGNYTDVYGRAVAIGPSETQAYAVVEAQEGISLKVFTHEAGHLYGCRHTPQADPSGISYAHAYRFKPNIFAAYCNTVMTEGGVTGNTILNFSNPNISISGKPTGTTGSNHNARRMNETFATVRNFRGAPAAPLGASIDGPTWGAAYSGFYTWEAVTYCGQVPFTYQWSVGYDGFNYSPRGTGVTLSEALPCPSGNQFFIRLVVTGSNGQQATSFLTVTIDKTNCSGGYYRMAAANPLESTLKVSDLSSVTLGDAYPNPVADHTRIEFFLPQPGAVQLVIKDHYGRPVQTLAKGNYEAGFHIQDIDRKALTDGLYYYELRTGSFRQAKKLLLTK